MKLDEALKELEEYRDRIPELWYESITSEIRRIFASGKEHRNPMLKITESCSQKERDNGRFLVTVMLVNQGQANIRSFSKTPEDDHVHVNLVGLTSDEIEWLREAGIY